MARVLQVLSEQLPHLREIPFVRNRPGRQAPSSTLQLRFKHDQNIVSAHHGEADEDTKHEGECVSIEVVTEDAPHLILVDAAVYSCTIKSNHCAVPLACLQGTVRPAARAGPAPRSSPQLREGIRPGALALRRGAGHRYRLVRVLEYGVRY